MKKNNKLEEEKKKYIIDQYKKLRKHLKVKK